MLERVTQPHREWAAANVRVNHILYTRIMTLVYEKGRQICVPADAVIREARVFPGIIRGVKGA